MLVACEFSGVVRDAFRAGGHDAMSCDLLPTERPGPHWHGDVFDILSDDWDMMIAHPPCTYLCRAGYHWCNRPDSEPGVRPLKGEPRRKAMIEAAAFFMALFNCDIPRVAIENPRPISHAGLPHPSQTIHPWQHGHGETKATCLWLRGLPPLCPSHIVTGRDNRIWKMPPGSDRQKERSRTYQGIADAMAEQWGAS